MECPSCGAHNSGGAAYCSLCFQPLASSPEPGVVQGVSGNQSGGPAVAAVAPAVTRPAHAQPPEPAGCEPDLAAKAAAYLGEDCDAGVYSTYSASPVLKPSNAFADPKMIGLLIRYGLGPALLLLAFAAWAVSGGLGAANKGKVAHLYVPPGAEMIANVKEIQRGVFATLSPERAAVYSTRIFAVPMSAHDAWEYYSKGAGKTALAAEGWEGPTEERALFGIYWEFSRVVPISPTTRAEQHMHIVIDDKPKMVDDAGQAAMAKIVPGQTSAIRIGVTGSSIEQVDWKSR